MPQSIRRKGHAWYFRPFTGAWRFASLFEQRLGISATLFTGAFLMAVGALLCLTIAGAIFGIPVAFVGMMLILRALY